MKAILVALLVLSTGANAMTVEEAKKKHHAYQQCLLKCNKAMAKRSCHASCNKQFGVIG